MNVLLVVNVLEIEMKDADGILLGAPGKVLEDSEGMQIMRVLGKNIAWLRKVLEVVKAQFESHEAEHKIFMNFIREFYSINLQELA